MDELLQQIMDDHAELLGRVREQSAATITAAGRVILTALEQGNTVFVCGNGGSAADAQHFAAELVGLFDSRRRRALPGIALTVDASALTSISNDFGYEQVFARQLEGLARPGDVLIGITTSGRSKNVLAAMEKAYELGVVGVGLAGADPSALAPYCAEVVSIPHDKTARIQEMHIMVIHAWCKMVDEKFARA
jgi:D-sedoheptulose 7-phosphate isomerase